MDRRCWRSCGVCEMRRGDFLHSGGLYHRLPQKRQNMSSTRTYWSTAMASMTVMETSDISLRDGEIEQKLATPIAFGENKYSPYEDSNSPWSTSTYHFSRTRSRSSLSLIIVSSWWEHDKKKDSKMAGHFLPVWGPPSRLRHEWSLPWQYHSVGVSFIC